MINYIKNIFKNANLFWKILTPILIIFPIAIYFQISKLSNSTFKNTVKGAEKVAINTIDQYKTLRGYYTKNIVKKVKASNTHLKFHFNHKGVKNTLPLPASVIHDLSGEFAKNKDGIRLKLYSDQPFPNRKDRVLDAFQKNAIAYLKKNPDEVFKQTFTHPGKEHVRVAIADKLVAKGCVSCHNSHPDTPFNNWKLGDVRGILEVNAPINEQVLANTAMVSELKWLSLFFNGLIIGMIVLSLFIFVFKPTKKIAEISQKLKKNAEDTLTNSNSLNELSSGLGSQAQKQATSIQQTVSTLDEISSMVRKTSEGTGETTNLAENSNKKVQEGQGAVKEMVNSMDKISESSNTILAEMERNNDELRDIVTVINEISDKTKVINDIVFQTKLLSFNASVEAARAGEHGKGFAVVAEEVGNLAAMSGEAAGEISEILDRSVKTVEGIIDKTKSKVSALVAEGQTSVQEGSEITKKCAKIFEDLVSNVNQVRENMNELSVASKEQSTGVHEISQSMNELSGVSTHFNSSASELDNLSSTLTKQANGLANSIAELEKLVLGQGQQNSKETTNDNVVSIDQKASESEDTDKAA